MALTRQQQKAIHSKINQHKKTLKIIDVQDKARRKFLKTHGANLIERPDGSPPISHIVNIARARKREDDAIKKLRMKL